MQTQEEFFANKLMDLANLAAATLVFGQLLTGQIFWKIFLMGMAFFLLSSMISYLLMKQRRD